MKKELEEKLYAEFPKFFGDRNRPPSESAMCWGCQCEDGWYDLIRETCQKLETLDLPENFRFNTVKQKLGPLRIYADNSTKQADAIINIAANKSTTICEFCGSKDGVAKRPGYWICYLCPDCTKNYQKLLSK